MIGLVVVSHSAAVAESVCQLAAPLAQGKMRLAAAGGAPDPEYPVGTDPVRVLNAIESVWSEEGVIVLMDLGSALLNAETALDLLGEDRRAGVHLCAAPLVEGAVAAASLAAAGAGIAEILREAGAALASKVAQIGAAALPPAAPVPAEEPAATAEKTVILTNPLGLHARPAAELVRLAREFAARVTVENLDRAADPAPAVSINGLLSLGARQGDRLRLRADGTGAAEAVEALGRFIEDLHSEAPPADRARPDAAPGEGQLTGIPGSAGVAIGPLVRLHPAPAAIETAAAEDADAEWARLEAAIRGARQDTRALQSWAENHAGRPQAAIFEAQCLFLEDPQLLAGVSDLVFGQRCSAGLAWRMQTEELAARLNSLDDPYLRTRAADVADVAERVARRLAGQGPSGLRLAAPAVVAARDLAPSEVADLDPAHTLGLALEGSSANSHSVILARAMGIPTVAGLGPPLAAVAEGTTVALDGEAGILWISPSPVETRRIEERRANWLRAREAARTARHRPAATREGRRVRVLANISSVTEAAAAVDSGAEGVGVLRTEFLFQGRTNAPAEEEQRAAYREIAASLGGRPLVIRTLDAGGDKDLPYMNIGEEPNPFLGWRGVRLTLGRPEICKTQIRAILRAAAASPVDILLPMVACLEELRECKALIAAATAELEGEGIVFHRRAKTGVMIEVPAAALMAAELAREADFFSIGTNDLCQYVMAADRTSVKVASLADPFQPPVLRLLRLTVDAARAVGIEVTVCGEMAADPLATPLLLGLGVDEFSVSAHLIPELKTSIGRWTLPEARRRAEAALAADSAAAVRRILGEPPGEP